MLNSPILQMLARGLEDFLRSAKLQSKIDHIQFIPVNGSPRAAPHPSHILTTVFIARP